MNFSDALKSGDAFKRPAHDNWLRRFPDGKIMELRANSWVQAQVETSDMLADDWKTLPVEIIFTWAAMCDLTATVEQMKEKLS